ncbi:MAG: hypothetical protein M3O71_00550, partial [Bacteroidota bacterium]|nr:hypothetical protein [Bacteroidota bacterium]
KFVFLFPSFPEDFPKKLFFKRKNGKKESKKRVPAAGKRKRNKSRRVNRPRKEGGSLCRSLLRLFSKSLRNAGKTLAAFFSVSIGK